MTNCFETCSAPGDPWWELPLADLSDDQWERLCDGCGWCCMHKLEDGDTGLVYYTRVACDLLDIETCRCRDYARRRQQVPDCRQLSQEHVARMHWLPTTCAYRRRWHGESLPRWHYLISGDRSLVHRLEKSIRSVAVARPDLDTELLQHELLDFLPWATSVSDCTGGCQNRSS